MRAVALRHTSAVVRVGVDGVGWDLIEVEAGVGVDLELRVPPTHS